MPRRVAALSRALVTVSFILTLAPDASARKLQVCTFSFHGPQEIEAFRSHLPSSDFDFVDLSPPPLLQGQDAVSVTDLGGGSGAAWLAGHCKSDLHCDVAVISAEFAGRFFGRCGQSLSLQEMEEASCQARCDGLFHSPREVFLLACNTLATKDPDQRTPAQYLQVLLDHGFDRASAERMVAFRYGPVGPTFREALRRVFAGVPRIYGFSSVAPVGTVTGPMLDRYFKSIGDYRRHLERLQAEPTNTALLSAFAGTALVQTSGLTPTEGTARDRDRICALYDEGRSVADRLEIVEYLVGRPDMLEFIPSIQAFVERHPQDRLQGDAKRIFDAIADNQDARERVRTLVRALDVSALQLELAHFASHLGWVSEEELRALAFEAARELLRRPFSSEVVDVMCEIPKHEPIGDHFTSADFPPALFSDPEGIRLVSCIAPPDARVSERLAAALDSPDTGTRLWAAHALTRRPSLSDAVLVEVAGRLGDPSPDVRERLEWIFRARAPLSAGVQNAVSASNPRLAAELRPRR
ncbi:MAG TPA: hypothetical protein VFD92_20060 [Candidatus Binatia bacterium]|nr:hypothetical protein [Candidatus Binatia bacterium]